ncbi:MAG: hypothetical protein N0A24_00845 [Armatimonadetes bacterium]|nr:hypothetical protein [Armatimonadota bacterium]MDW8152767.1 hypothetical protein [Armatimonadota bacterium]
MLRRAVVRRAVVRLVAFAFRAVVLALARAVVLRRAGATAFLGFAAAFRFAGAAFFAAVLRAAGFRAAGLRAAGRRAGRRGVGCSGAGVGSAGAIASVSVYMPSSSSIMDGSACWRCSSSSPERNPSRSIPTIATTPFVLL